MSNGMYSPSPDPFLQFRDAQGAPLAGGQLFTYVAGTTSPQLTYSDVGLTVPNPNPIVLQSDGTNPQGPIFLVPGWSYRYVLQDAQGNTIWTRDNIMVESGTGGTPPPTGPSSLVDQGAPAVDANSWPMHVVGPVTVAQPVEVVGVATGTPLPVTGTVAVSQPVLVNQGAPATAANAWPTTVLGQVIVSQGNPNSAINAWPVQVTQQPVSVNLVAPATVPVSGTINQGAPAVSANAWPVTIASGAGPGGVVQVSGPVTMSDGANVTQGYLNDVAASSASGSWSIASILKGILSRFTSGIVANQGTPNTSANAWPVAIVSGGSGGTGGAVTIADGANITQGAMADPAATNTTGSWSTIALQKAMLARWSGTGGVLVNQGLPAADTGAWPVKQASASNPWIVQPVAGSQVAVVGSVTVGNFPATQPVSGTITANQGTPLANTAGNAWPVQFPAAQSVNVANTPGVTITGQPINVNVSSGNVGITGSVSSNQGNPNTDANSWPIRSVLAAGKAAVLGRITMTATGVGDVVVVSVGAGNRAYIYRLLGVANGAMSIFFRDGAGGGGLTGVMALITSQMIVLDLTSEPWFVTSPGNSFVVNVSTGASFDGVCYYYVGP